MQNQIYRKEKRKNASRKFLSLPQANINIGTFFNEKLQSAIYKQNDSVLYISERFSYPTKQKRFSFTFSPKFEVNNNKIIVSFDDFAQKKNIFRKLLKYSSMNLKESNIKNNLIISQKRLQAKGQQFQQRASPSTLNKKKSVLLDHDHQNIIRKQLEEKFNRTRMVFKEEQKIKRYDKIQKIYERKYPITKFVHPRKQQRVQFNQCDKCSPWFKNRIEECQVEIYKDESFQDQII